MSRFDNLELDDRGDAMPSPAAAPIRGAGAPIRDEQWFRSAAEKAHRICRYETALSEYSRLLQENNAAPAGWVGQVRMLVELREYNEAEVWSGKALELFPDLPDLLAARSMASTRMGKLSLGLAQSDHALSREGVTPYVWLARAEVLLATRNRLFAHCLQKAANETENQTARAWTHWEVARLLRRYKRPALAIASAEGAVKSLPAEAGAWHELGCCRRQLGLLEAKAAFARAVELDTDCEAARIALRDWRDPGIMPRVFNLFRRRRAAQ